MALDIQGFGINVVLLKIELKWIVRSIILWLELKKKCWLKILYCAWLNFQVQKQHAFCKRIRCFLNNENVKINVERMSCKEKIHKILTNKQRFFHMQKNFSNFIYFHAKAPLWQHLSLRNFHFCFVCLFLYYFYIILTIYRGKNTEFFNYSPFLAEYTKKKT